MNEIMTSNRLNEIRTKMLLIHNDCFDQFVAGVISWYQHEITHPTVYFYDKNAWQQKPPNVFHLFEYPKLSSDPVLNLFIESDTIRLMEATQYDYKQAQERAIKFHNTAPAERYDFMVNDVEMILNGYHLFYCYQDDANFKGTYHNHYINEVW